MNLPIPEIRESCLPHDKDSREAFLEFQELVKRLEPALRAELRFRKDTPFEFPQILASWLFSSLQRVRVTCWGVISSLNSDNEVVFVLAVRALIESTGYLAYVDEKLSRTYAGDMTRQDMTMLAFQIKFANRKPADFGLTDSESELSKAVNVLTAIRRLDRVFQHEFQFKSDRTVTDWYDRLSEFCHPNTLGASIGSTLDFPGGTETFELEPGIRPAIRDQFGRYLRLTSLCFCVLYNRCWEEMISRQEVLPDWTPCGHPRIMPE